MTLRQRSRLLGKRKKNSSSIHPIYGEYRDISQYWMLQILVPLGAHKEMIAEQICLDDEVLCELGLTHLVETTDFKGLEARKTLFELHKAMSEKPAPKIPRNTQLARNIRWLAKVVGLSPTEQAILLFRVIASRHLPLRACLDRLGNGVDQLYAVNLIAKLINTAESAVEKALQPGGKLTCTGLISIDPGLKSLMDKITLLPGMADSLFGKHHNPYSLFLDNFTQSRPSKLTKMDYPHLKEDIYLLSNYLAEALDKKQPGVNILIYGTPGSGKTEFVKMLAQEIGRPLFEVATENVAGDPIRRANRFRSFRLSQHILATSETPSIILFDEIEDVFRFREDEEEQKVGNPSGMKGWINKLLEGNQVPSFWLSNNLRCLDKAFVRRFDYVIELNAPPRSVRSKILDQYLDGIEVSPSWKANMAEHEHLNPAVVERAAKVIEIAKQQPELYVEKTLEKILGNTLDALGLPRSPKNTAQCVTDYRLDILNTDCSISDVCDGLRKHGEGRLCLYGPPGTGKSAFGRFLADMLDKPLLVRRASDILSMWVGGTEQNMAKMFREASQENAVLLLDEADTFLRDRNSATRNWEVSEVNEMLAQMETFEGIFIASTNLMGTLDAASLRRFDMKVKFDYLRPEQAWQLFLDTTAKFQLDTNETHRSILDGLNFLTPGDFANVVRQSRLRTIGSATELISLLEAECEVKPEGCKRKVGF